MDIPVSRLNQRMALQLPAELPLGLVFVVGQVESPAGPEAAQNPHSGEFYLRDKGYRLPCRLSERAAAEFRLEEGAMVRAGGHLVFEPVLASYYLLARDIERLDAFRPAAKPLAAIIADNSRREQAASLTPADLPPWVQRMAPPEVRLEPEQRPQGARRQVNERALNHRAVGESDLDSRSAPDLDAPAPQMGGDWELLADAEAAVAYPEAEPALAGMSDELIAFLSQAMDSQVEVEITPEIMTDLNTTGKTDRLSADVLEALDLFEASVTGETADQGQSEADTGAGQTPGGQTMTWLDQADGPADLDDQEPVGQAITAAEFTRALEDAASVEAADPVVPEKQLPKAPAAGQKPQSAPASGPDDVIPWYLALLIILVVLIVLAGLIYIALNPGSLALDLSLALPQEIPLLN